MLGKVFGDKRKRAVRKIVDAVGVNEDTAYAMILMTSALMDLSPDDGRVVELILQDCGVMDTDGAA